MSDAFFMIKIYVTTNYDQFVLLEENREIRGTTVFNSIKKKNLLKDNPILVTPRMQVLDGQHRLHFARMEKVSIYYKIADVTDIEDIGLLQNQRPWQISDYANFYNKNENYDFVQEISDKYDFPLHFVITCCIQGSNPFSEFRSGKFQINEEKHEILERFRKLKEIIELIKFNIGSCTSNFSNITQKFKRALWTFMKKKDYDHKRLMHSIKMYPNNLIPLLSNNSEKLIFQGIEEKIYNYRRKNTAID